MPITTCSDFINESEISHSISVEEYLNFDEDERVTFVNILFFVDNRTQELLYKSGIKIKVIRTKKLDLGFMLLTDYKGSAEQNEAVVNFLNEFPSYWQIEDDKLKVNKNLILDHRRADIDKITKYFEVSKSDFIF